MAIALVVHTKIIPAGNSGGTSSPGIDTSGANLIVFGVTFANTHSVTVSDNKSNSYTALSTASTAAQDSLLYYCLNPTVGTGHTFTISGAGSLESMCIAAFSGVKTSGAFDQQNTNTDLTSGTTIQPGSVTPTADGSLVITVHGTSFVDSGGGVSINSGFSQTDYVPVSAGTYYGTALAYFVQGTAAAINPTWTDSVTNSFRVATVASFLPANATVNLSGVAGTAAAGTLTATGAATVTLSGIQSTAAVGSFSEAVTSSFSLAGVAATASAGSLSAGVSHSVALAGVSATATTGALTPHASSSASLLGIQATAFASTIYPTQVILTVPMITIMNDLPIPVEGDMVDDDVPMEGDMPYQLAFESVINTNPIPMSGTMSADTVPGEGSVP